MLDIILDLALDWPLGSLVVLLFLVLVFLGAVVGLDFLFILVDTQNRPTRKETVAFEFERADNEGSDLRVTFTFNGKFHRVPVDHYTLDALSGQNTADIHYFIGRLTRKTYVYLLE